jgi:hypothetical protein
LPRIAAALERLAARYPPPEVLHGLQRWTGPAGARGACHHPVGTARFAGSALGVFAAEIGEHQRGRCTATTSKLFLPTPEEVALDERDWY